MNFMVNIDLDKLKRPISYGHNILLTGSCFTEHIGNSLLDVKFSVLQNPNGILFDPLSVSDSLLSYITNERYSETDLFLHNEVWNSWQHHSRFSNTNLHDCLYNINASQQKAHEFLKTADWVIITLGSSFSYSLIPGSCAHGVGQAHVANCHRAPAQWFQKTLLPVDRIISSLDNCIQNLFQFNKKLQLILTVSPVRHIRDGVIDNNRSKARLIESVHHLVTKFEPVHYFPAYELVIDVLRDYRFFDVDLVHPNYMATEFVLEKFASSCIDEDSRVLMEEIKKIIIARKHKPFQPATDAHKNFLKTHFEKVKALQQKHAFLNLENELNFFANHD